MKQFTFLTVFLIFVSFSSYAQNQDFDSRNINSNIQGIGVFSPLTTATWSALQSSPNTVSRSCCTAIKRGDTVFVYQFGGGSTTSLKNVARYNKMTNSWTNNVSTIPFAISAGSAVTLPGDSLIYVIGGDNSSSTYGKCMKYNIITNTWTTMADMTPNPCTDQLTVVYRDSLIICVGGGNGVFGSTSVQYNSVRIYNTKSNTWTPATNLPATLGMSGGGICRDTIIVVSGTTGSTYPATVYKGEINPSNITSITWTTLPNYPGGGISRMASYFVKVGDGGGIMCTGGAVNGGTVTNSTYLWNFCTHSWQTLPASTLARSNYKGCGFGDSVVYCVAGYTTTGTGTVDKISFSQIDGSCFVTSFSNNQTTIPVEYSLSQNYPNPFNPMTKIQFTIPKSGFVKLSVYNILGKEVDLLVNEYRVAGSYIVDLDISNLNSGVYFYKITSGNFTDTKRMMLIK
jgi:N-acetylneuraminic acid mutarotase